VLCIRHRNSPGDPVVVAVPARHTGVGVVAQVKGDCLQSETAEFAQPRRCGGAVPAARPSWARTAVTSRYER
jgi:hypothetical protein